MEMHSSKRSTQPRWSLRVPWKMVTLPLMNALMNGPFTSTITIHANNDEEVSFYCIELVTWPLFIISNWCLLKIFKTILLQQPLATRWCVWSETGLGLFDFYNSSLKFLTIFYSVGSDSFMPFIFALSHSNEVSLVFGHDFPQLLPSLAAAVP